MNRQDLVVTYQNLSMHRESDSVEHFAYGYIHALLSGSRDLSWVQKQLRRASKTSRGLEHDNTLYDEYQTNDTYMMTKVSIYEEALERLALLESTKGFSSDPVERSSGNGEHFEIPLLASSSFP